MEGICVLVVDDDESICEYMCTLLERKGYTADYEIDSLRALERLRAGDYYQIVVLDLLMPRMGGLELLGKLRHFDRDLGVIIATGHATIETAVFSLRYRVDDYVRKPFDAAEFTEVVERVARQRGLVRAPEHELLVEIGRTIRERRKGRDLTLKQLSRRTGLSTSLISQIERADSSASVSSLHKIASALGCRVTDLFGAH